MNRNTLIGFSLIAVVLILFSYLNTPSQEQIDAYNHQQDSIAAVKHSVIMLLTIFVKNPSFLVFLYFLLIWTTF